MLYQFDSELLRQYSDGDIITRADSVDEARQQIRGRWLAHILRGPFSRLWSEDHYIRDLDDNLKNDYPIEWADAWEDIVKPYRLLIEDLSKEPKILPDDAVIFILGSE